MGRSPSPPRRRREKEKDKERSEQRKKRRERARERSRDRERDRDRESRRQRSRERRSSSERERARRRSRSRSSTERGLPSSSRGRPDRPELSEADLAGKSPEEIEMMKTMGFCNFDTTKNKKVDGNDVGEVHVILKRKYRQYMNRKGGFNRPLDFVA